jgi:ferrous iron transport protein B
MQSFDWNFQLVENPERSILHSFASPIALLLVPIGAGVWQLAAGAVTGFIAKENVVGTLAVCYGFMVNDDLEMVSSSNEVAAAMVTLTKVSALAYLMFNLFTPPCFAAIGAMNAEIKDRKWFWGGIALQLATGYSVGYLVYTIGTLITAPATLNVGAALGGLLFVLAFAGVLVYLCVNAEKQRDAAAAGRN